ncbi:MAG TPA: hypothetical protein VGE81_02950 [Candidatus Limnocylindrales bacterium]|jgi:hypothetical protein
MTTPDRSSADPRSSGPELPVWQLEVPPAEPFASIEELDSDELLVDEVDAIGIDSRNNLIDRSPVRPQRANSVTVLLAVSAIVALGGVSFAVGRMVSTGGSTTGQAAVAGANGPTTGGNGLPGPAANPGGGPIAPGTGAGIGVAAGTTMVSGTVVSVGSGSITVQQANGQTVTIVTDSSTSYRTQTAATNADVTTGATVIVQTSGRSGFGRERGGISAGASPGVNFGRAATSVTIVSQ